MKKTVILLVALLSTSAAYNQTSRRSSDSTKDRTTTRTTTERTTTRSRTEAAPVRSTTTTRSTSTTRPAERSRSTTTAAPVKRPTTTTTTTNTTRSHSTVHTTPTRRSTNVHVVEYASPRVHRTHHKAHHHYSRPPATREYRSTHYVYRRPAHIEFSWTPQIHRRFISIYPMVHHWEYRVGTRFDIISSYDAIYYRGEVATVYGEVNEVYYSRATDEYFLYFGPYYPHHDFTVVIPGYLARSYSRNPARYFERQYLAVSGLITSYEGEPEIYVKEDFQVNFY